ncbi:hypothetical protein [Candidatus Moranella endobia]|nr:hypothetical protein [Candidatus Moranella endobia]
MVFARIETTTIIASALFTIMVYNFYNNVHYLIKYCYTVAETPDLDSNR